MPIKPENRDLYSDDWKEISLWIRERSGNKCEICGIPNGDPNPVTGSVVILTVMHLDHNPMNNNPANLKAACQRCHLRYDVKHHCETRKNTRNKKLGIIELPFSIKDPK